METLQNKLFLKREIRDSFLSFSFMKLIPVIGAILFFGMESLSQELTSINADSKLPVLDVEMSPPNEHKQRVYVNEEKFIFWPQDKPVFFWLGTSSDEKAELFPLLHSGTMNKAGHWKSHSKEVVEKYRREGLKLEISSNQFVRWLHFYNKKESTYRFLADGIPPVSKIFTNPKIDIKFLFFLFK